MVLPVTSISVPVTGIGISSAGPTATIRSPSITIIALSMAPEPSPVKEVQVGSSQPVAQAYALEEAEIGGVEPLDGDSDWIAAVPGSSGARQKPASTRKRLRAVV